MRTFGLIGYPLSHSFSQKYFTEKFKRENFSGEFKNFPLEDINQFPALIKNNPTLIGLSITIPHKQTVMRFLDELDISAKKVGAVNCIRIKNRESGIKIGYNTDIFGFEQSFNPFLRLTDTKSRTSNILSYLEINQEVIQEHLIIINTTPLGMFPNVNECPNIPYEYLTDKHFLYDLTYNPEETLFLKKGKEKGAQIKNGLEMLHLQAEKAWGIWNS